MMSDRVKQLSPQLSVVLPCYNEEGLFRESVARIREVLENSRYSYEIIFVDDNSKDGTAGLIRSHCEAHKNMRAIYHTTNFGRGQTVADGLKASQGIVAGYIDIDCEVSPVYIPSMASRILHNQADVVIGRRFYRTSPRAVVREVLSRGYQWLSNKLIGTGGMDTETGYKFFNRKKILPVLRDVQHKGWFWDTEIMVYAMRAGLRIIEEPVLFLRRFDKVSSVNIIKDTIDYMIQLWALRGRLTHS